MENVLCIRTTVSIKINYLHYVHTLKLIVLNDVRYCYYILLSLQRRVNIKIYIMLLCMPKCIYKQIYKNMWHQIIRSNKINHKMVNTLSINVLPVGLVRCRLKMFSTLMITVVNLGSSFKNHIMKQLIKSNRIHIH